MNLLSFYGLTKDISKLFLTVTGIDPRTNEKIVKHLIKHGIQSLQQDFKSVYVFSLIEYGEVCKPRELVNLFANKEVIDAFANHLYHRNDGPDFDVVVDDILNTCKDKPFLKLKRDFRTADLNKEINSFKAIFKQKTRDSKNPADIDTDNKLHEILELLKESASRSANIPKELTARIPRMQPDKIVGREHELEELNERLAENRQVVLVNGLGGIGKTTLAQAYIDKYWDEYQHLAWIDKTSKDAMSDIVYAEGLTESLGVHKEGRDLQDCFNDIAMALKRIDSQPNLLIIDNAEAKFTDLRDYLPGQPQWHVLVTSRENIEQFDLMELDFLSEPEAVELFLTHYKHGRIDAASIRELVNTVGLHTLTVEILAKTAHRRRITPDLLKTAIEDDLRANVYIGHNRGKIEKITSYLCSVFDMSELNEIEIWLLKQFACLPPEFHPYDLLLELIDPGEREKQDLLSEILEDLSDKGWLLHNEETDSFKMHQIISDIVQTMHAVTLEDVKPLLHNITGKLSLDQTKDNPVDKFVWIPYGLAVSEIFSGDSSESVSSLQNELGLRFKEFGDYEGAKGLLEKALKSAEKNFGPDHPTTAVSYLNLATVLEDLGDYEEAVGLTKKTLENFKKNFQENHPYLKQAINIHEHMKSLMNQKAAGE